MAGIMGYTHYMNNGENSNYSFELDTCETCGGDIQAPNGVTICEPESKMASLGLKKWEGEFPADSYYDEATDKGICDNCLQ